VAILDQRELAIRNADDNSASGYPLLVLSQRLGGGHEQGGQRLDAFRLKFRAPHAIPGGTVSAIRYASDLKDVGTLMCVSHLTQRVKNGFGVFLHISTKNNLQSKCSALCW
jgi:hypothetical protein